MAKQKSRPGDTPDRLQNFSASLSTTISSDHLSALPSPCRDSSTCPCPSSCHDQPYDRHSCARHSTDLPRDRHVAARPRGPALLRDCLPGLHRVRVPALPLLALPDPARNELHASCRDPHLCPQLQPTRRRN